MLTEKQQAVLDFVREQVRTTGVVPSTREIQDFFGFASQTAAMNHLRALERKGALTRLPRTARGIMLPEAALRVEVVEIPVYGRIAAGMPDGAEQSAEETVVVDLRLAGTAKQGTFALRVRGDSMIDAHIVSGDIVLLESREPKPGDIVAALIDGETTLKRYLVRNGRPYLKAENPAYPELIPARELVVQGVMVGLLRGRGRR